MPRETGACALETGDQIKRSADHSITINKAVVYPKVSGPVVSSGAPEAGSEQPPAN